MADEEKTVQKGEKSSLDSSLRKVSKSSDSLRGAAKVAARKEEKNERHAEENKEIQVLAASNIDDALDLMAHVSASAESPGKKANAVERHPERRAKAA